MEEARSNSGQIIRKTLIRMYPGTLVYATMLGFMYMVDNIIAGNAMGPEAIAAVAIALPSYGMFLALMNAIVHGTCLRIWSSVLEARNHPLKSASTVCCICVFVRPWSSSLRYPAPCGKPSVCLAIRWSGHLLDCSTSSVMSLFQ